MHKRDQTLSVEDRHCLARLHFAYRHSEPRFIKTSSAKDFQDTLMPVQLHAHGVIVLGINLLILAAVPPSETNFGYGPQSKGCHDMGTPRVVFRVARISRWHQLTPHLMFSPYSGTVTQEEERPSKCIGTEHVLSSKANRHNSAIILPREHFLHRRAHDFLSRCLVSFRAAARIQLCQLRNGDLGEYSPSEMEVQLGHMTAPDVLSTKFWQFCRAGNDPNESEIWHSTMLVRPLRLAT